MKRICALALLGLVLSVPAAFAEKKPIDIMSCRSGEVSLLSATKEATFMAIDHKGVNVNSGNKYFDNQTHRCVGVIGIILGKTSSRGFCKYMNPSGDFFIVDWKGTGKSGECTWKFVQGTGIWKGVKGGGMCKRVEGSKPIHKGTYQNCLRVTGTFELPK